MPFETNYFVSNTSGCRDATFKITLLWLRRLKRENSLVIRSNLARNFLERQSADVPRTRGLAHDFLPCPLRDWARIIPVRLRLTNA